MDRLLGKELCVLAWAAETANDEQLPVICSKWAALRPEERWWLFSMTVAEAGLPEDTQRGWRRALFHALSDGEKPARRTQAPPPGRAGSFQPAAVRGLRMSNAVTPFSLKDAPALIERLLPVQKLSAEAYKEQMAVQGKTLTALGSYWKGRKPLILNKACILGCLLPATDDPARDLEIFEKLMAMDDESFVVRWKRRPKPKEILATLSIARIADYFTVEPEGVLPASAPVDWSNPDYDEVKVAWREDSPSWSAAGWKRRCCPRCPTASGWTRPSGPRRSWTPSTTTSGTRSTPTSARAPTRSRSWSSSSASCASATGRAWPTPSAAPARFPSRRLGSAAMSMPPTSTRWPACSPGVPSTSSAAPRRAARSWRRDQQELVATVQAEIDQLGVETDGNGWRAKVFLYCVEARCPQTGWMVPLLPTLIVSKGNRVDR